MSCLSSLWQDLSYGIRHLRASPGFAVTAVVTLALTTGVNTSIFSLLNALLLRPLAVPNGLFAVYRGEQRPASYPDYEDLRDSSNALTDLAAAATNESSLEVGEGSEVVLVEMISRSFAAVMGVKPELGRWLHEGDEREFNAVISHRVWQTRLGGDANVIGSKIRIESQPYTVVGVAPRDFLGLAQPAVTSAWVPIAQYARHNAFAGRLLRDRKQSGLLIFGRLRPGVTVAQAEAELNAIDKRLHRDYPRAEARREALRVETARGSTDPAFRRQVRQLLTLLTGVALLIILIGCANVANLLLARNAGRRREFSVRLALGAGRGRLFRQLLMESLLLSLLGAVTGISAAAAANHLLEQSLASAGLPIAVATQLNFDTRVFAFVAAMGVLTTLFFGMLPAWQSSRPDLVAALKGSEPFALRGRLTVRNAAVVAQVTASLVLLILAGLFLRGLESAHHMDPGFDTRGLVSARVFAPERDFDSTSGLILFQRILERARALPGTRGATLSYASPFIAMSKCASLVASPEKLPIAANVVGPDYFTTYGIPISHGRQFSTADRPSSPSVAIVSEALARRFWHAGQDPLEAQLRVSTTCNQGESRVVQVVGVARDSQFGLLGSDVRPAIFFPVEQHYVGYVSVVVRGATKPDLLRKALRAADPRVHVYEVESLSAQIDRSLWQIRWGAALLGGFGLLALTIAAVGVHGVVAFVTRRRMREFGVRTALGAQRADLLRTVMTDACVLTLVGVGLGVAIALMSTGLLKGFLYGLSPTDPTVFALAALTWMVTSLVASLWPAYKASRVDPVAVLREE